MAANNVWLQMYKPCSASRITAIMSEKNPLAAYTRGFQSNVY